ncbi:MAG: hypothetical protein ACR2QF_18015 [Geminicoccaceae bacterium]
MGSTNSVVHTLSSSNIWPMMQLPAAASSSRILSASGKVFPAAFGHAAGMAGIQQHQHLALVPHLAQQMLDALRLDAVSLAAPEVKEQRFKA